MDRVLGGKGTSVWAKLCRWLSILPRKTSTWHGSMLTWGKKKKNSLGKKQNLSVADTPASEDVKDEEEVTPVLCF